MESTPRLHTRLLDAALFLVVFLVLQHDLVLGRAIVPFDGDQFYAPYYTLVADYARAGQLLWWNPFVDGGLPDFVEPQTGALSPLVLAFGLVTGGTEAGFRAYFLCVWAFSGLGVLALGWRLGAPRWGAFAVALGFAFSGYHLGHAEHVSWLWSFGLLPFELLLVDRALARRSPFVAAQAGLVWGLSFFGGYPAHVLCTAVVCVAWALARRPEPRAGEGSGSARVRAALLLLPMFLVGLVILLPGLVGLTYEAAGVTSRAGVIPREVAIGQNYLEPRALTTLFSPYFARLNPSLLWPATDVSSSGMYPGVLVLVLALFALVARPRSRRRWAVAVLGVAALLCALGPTLPVRGWLYDFVYPTRYFRHPALFRGYFVFALAVLALVGARDLERTRRTWKLAPCALVLALAAGLAFWCIARIQSDELLGTGVSHLVVAWSAAVALGVWIARRDLGRGARAAFLALALLDAAMSVHLDRWHVDRSPQARATWDALAARHRPLEDLARTSGLGRSRAVIQQTAYGSTYSSIHLLAKEPTLLGYTTLVNDFHGDWVRAAWLAFAAMGVERTWFVERVLFASPSAELFAAFSERARRLPAIPIVVHPAASMTSPQDPPSAEVLAELGSLPSARRAATTLREYTPTKLRLDVDAPTDGWLLVTDRWARGWRAWVDGRPVELLGGDFVFRALPVRRGTNQVELRYEPRTRVLVFVSFAAMAALAAATIVRYSRAQRSNTQ